ncbi:MAG: hypothetical protein LBB34_03770 [Holosporales bacterium]|jgi:hypothetical protein|nr:hypothetical protein [Holosporales bacterium]
MSDMLDIEKMRDNAVNSYVTAAHGIFGDLGNSALLKTIDTLIKIYRNIDPSVHKNPIIAYRYIDPLRDIDKSKYISSVLSPDHITTELDKPCAIEISGSTTLFISNYDDFDPTELSRDAIVYLFKDQTEFFFIGGKIYEVINPLGQLHASIFSRPSYKSLMKALKDYGIRQASNSTCQILKNIWTDNNRLILCNKPEHIMRNSLTQFLYSVLQDAEVRPEQNVDDSHPVDIKITWNLTNRRAIIEIKWLGKSLSDTVGGYTSYTEARARSGAKQLADYLDSSHEFGPTVQTRGYLVIFDARRKNMHSIPASLSYDDGFHYANKEINFNPLYHIQRSDFEEPVRFFMAPLCHEVI